MGGVPVTWKLFKTDFMERFFPRKIINLKHGSMIVREYSLRFVKLSRHATSFLSKSRDEMCSLLIGVTRDMENECQAAMLHSNMDLFRVMVHVQ